jgi:hypothetical protein
MEALAQLPEINNDESMFNDNLSDEDDEQEI